MKRGVMVLFHSARTMSMLLLLAAAGLCIVSYGSEYTIWRGTRRTAQSISVSRGEMSFDVVWDNYYRWHDSTRDGWGLEKRPSSDLIRHINRSYPSAHPPVWGFFYGQGTMSGARVAQLVLPTSFV